MGSNTKWIKCCLPIVVLFLFTCGRKDSQPYGKESFAVEQKPVANNEAEKNAKELLWFAHDLRGELLSQDVERKYISELRNGKTAKDIEAAIAEQTLVSPKAIRSLVSRWLNAVPIKSASHHFAETLKRFKKDNKWIYFLESKVEGKNTPAQSCKSVEQSYTWWSPTKKITICSHSVVKQRPFDKVGWCGGQLEPNLSEPARKGCGCGSLMLACLPPEDEYPKLSERIAKEMFDEFVLTTADYVTKDASFNDLLTASDTWQTGLVSFLYLRREFVTSLRNNGFSKNLEEQFRKQMKMHNLWADGKMQPRSAFYNGTGLSLNTPYIQSRISTYRDIHFFTMDGLFCKPRPESVVVDRDAVLKSVEGINSKSGPVDVRFDVWDSPMQKQDGCKSCHLSMDSPSAFFGELQVPLQGSYHREIDSLGTFRINGQHDIRGSVGSQAEFIQLAMKQPEIYDCAVSRAFRALTDTNLSDRDLAQHTERFISNGYSLHSLFKGLLFSGSYKGARISATQKEGIVPAVDMGSKTVDPSIVKVIDEKCAICHDSDHKSIDLSVIPRAQDNDSWNRILKAIETRRMPPDGGGRIRYPMDPVIRNSIVTKIKRLLSEGNDRPFKKISLESWFRKLTELSLETRNAGSWKIRMQTYRDLAEATRGATRQSILVSASMSVCRELIAQGNNYQVTSIYKKIFGKRPDADSLIWAQQKVDKTVSTGESEESALSALCTGYMTGAKIWHEI